MLNPLPALHPLPERFTFPFHYTPHPLALAAAEALQKRLETEDFGHFFGLPQDNGSGEPMGKMFGVLVVQTPEGQLGYLSAFSGKLGGKNHHPGFVPPVFDLLDANGFYRPEEDELSAMNRRIEALEQSPELHAARSLLRQETDLANQQLQTLKAQQKAAKAERQAQRHAAAPEAFAAVDAAMTEASKRDHFELKDLKKNWQERLQAAQGKVENLEQELHKLRETRKNRSAALQQRIFEQYTFLNIEGRTRSIGDIFQAHLAAPPPAGAGECAAPKLLQYAFQHGLRPLALAEFWWGASPSGEIRKHRHYYPACRGKCEPILGHMLAGMALDDNPLRTGSAAALELEILYEDETLLLVNKPAGLLSVPGKEESDSVYLRIKRLRPEATGPMIVHRLDMSTSGLLLLAKNEETYKILQSQFLTRSVSKRYEALLEGEIQGESGIINLPLRVDLDDRPRQMVCYEHGKAARTEWTVVARTNGQTRVHFFPITGRTHQLRVHAAHPLGLNTPIVGDELYGHAGARLCLHAAELAFTHPQSGEQLRFVCAAMF